MRMSRTFAAVPSASAWRRNAVAVQTLGNGLLVPALLREFVEDSPDNGHFPFVAQCQRNALVLNALPFPRLKDLDRLPSLVEQAGGESRIAAFRRPSSPAGQSSRSRETPCR